MGQNYIMPIYCKFLNRSVVHEILRRRHLLKNARNELNNPYIIRENLTFNRRLLWDSVQENLGHFRYKWVKRGKIYVRHHANSKVIKVLSERVLNDLIAKNHHLVPVCQAAKSPRKRAYLREHAEALTRPTKENTQIDMPVLLTPVIFRVVQIFIVKHHCLFSHIALNLFFLSVTPRL